MLTFIKTTVDRSRHVLENLQWSGPLLVRLTVGLVFVMTGWGKLHSLDNVTEFFQSLGIPAPGFHALVVSSVELVGGLMLIVGLGTRIASALLIGVMAVAIWTAKLSEIHGLVDLANTIEFTYLAMFAWLLVQGPGAASIDHVVARRTAAHREPDPIVA